MMPIRGNKSQIWRYEVIVKSDKSGVLNGTDGGSSRRVCFFCCMNFSSVRSERTTSSVPKYVYIYFFFLRSCVFLKSTCIKKP